MLKIVWFLFWCSLKDFCSKMLNFNDRYFIDCAKCSAEIRCFQDDLELLDRKRNIYLVECPSCCNQRYIFILPDQSSLAPGRNELQTFKVADIMPDGEAEIACWKKRLVAGVVDRLELDEMMANFHGQDEPAVTRPCPPIKTEEE